MKDLLNQNLFYNKTTPYIAKFKSKRLLNQKNAIKETYHVTLSINPEEISYSPGDSLAVLPHNDTDLCNRLLKHLSLLPTDTLIDPRLGEKVSAFTYFATRVNFARISSSLLATLADFGWNELSLLSKEELETFLQGKDLLDILIEHPGRMPPLETLLLSLSPLLPRFYSISSTKSPFSDELDLLVALSAYSHKEGIRYGVASHYLCNLLQEGSPVAIYVQPSKHFKLPEEKETNIIMIGPGTGVAPYRAFLQERLQRKDSGRNWLFFGGRYQATDFFYEDFFRSLEKEGKLKLSTAFSRDQKEKQYVQHKLLQEAREVFAWINEGAILYVCGDATHMAKDVENTLLTILENEGHLSALEAQTFLKNLKRSKRYLTDVY